MNYKWDNNLKIYVINGILYSIMFNLYSPFAAKFLERLGGSEFEMSLFNALPGLIAVFATLPGTFLVARCYNKKKVTALFFFISRIMLLTFVFVPMLPGYIMPIVFVTLFSLRNFPEAVSQTAFQSFSGDLFSPEERSTAISLRSKFSIPATLLVTCVAGLILSKLTSSHAQVMNIYQIFFTIACAIGIIEIIVFMLFKEPQKVCVKDTNFRQTLKNVFENKKFRSFTIPSLLFYFTWQMGWPLFNIYQIINLGADEWWLSLITIFSSVGMFTGYSFWNRLIKEKGNHFVIWVSTMGMAVNPIIMAFSPNLYAATILNLFIGFFIAGTATVLLNYLLEVTPVENRVVYIGVYNTLVNVSLAISPFAAHFVLINSNIYLALIVVGLARFLSSLILFMSDRKATVNQHIDV